MAAMHTVLLFLAVRGPDWASLPHHIRPEPLRVLDALTPRHHRVLAAGELISCIARGHMHMRMPYVLMARRFMVLPRRAALAGVYRFHRQGHRLDECVQG